MKEIEQENRTGAGWVIYWKGIERRGREGMGRFAEVYDAMLALLRGLEAAIDFQQETPDLDGRPIDDHTICRHHVLGRGDNGRETGTKPTYITGIRGSGSAMSFLD